MARRCAAGLIDFAPVALLAALLGEVSHVGSAILGAGDALSEPLRKASAIVAFLAYHTLYPVLFGQATLGQRCCALRLASAGGRPAAPGEALGHALALLCAMLPFGAGLLLGMLPGRRPLQDLLCQTRVVCAVDTMPPVSLTPPAFEPT